MEYFNHTLGLTLSTPGLVNSLLERTALKQGNVTRIEECLDQEAVDPNMKVIVQSIESEPFMFHVICSLLLTPQAMFPSPRQLRWTDLILSKC